LNDAEARERVERVEGLLDELESLPDAAARDSATAMAQALLDLYGEGLARVMRRVAEGGGALSPEALAEDELIAHLLLLHDLHPVALETRVRGALDEVRPYLESHGGNVEVVGIEEGVVHLRLQGSCSGCPSSAMTLKLAIEDAIHKAAPDVEAIEAEGTVADAPSQTGPQLLQLEVSDGLGGVGGTRGDGPAGADAAWAMAGGLSELSEGGAVVKDVAGERVLFLKVNGTLYSYRPMCPACGEPLEEPTLERSELVCESCGSHYDAIRAGRCLDAPHLSVEPVPLLVSDDGLVKVALRSPA
jgi:Fe-S cluster biogenesis protein NfuA/nitrite reductase/ring-hydroxylating ferredoxin subunit